MKAFVLNILTIFSLAVCAFAVTSSPSSPAVAAPGAHDIHKDFADLDHVKPGSKGEYAPKKKAGLPQLDVKTYASQIFWLAIMFILMYVPFRFKVLPDLSKVIERRREQIEGDLISAKNLKEEAETVHEAYDSILRDAREQASGLYIRAEEKIKELEKSTLDTFYKKSASQIEDVEAEVDAAKQDAMSVVSKVASQVALEAAQKIGNITPDIASAEAITTQLTGK